MITNLLPEHCVFLGMKWFGILLLCISIISSCAKDGEGDFSRSNTILRLGEATTVADDYEFRVDSLQDSRCPKGVECIWAGQVEVQIMAAKEGEEQLISLCLGPSEPCQSQDTFRDIRITLDSVAPYPQIEQEILAEDYLIFVTIESAMR
ncbi:MAG: hypothetical protein KTR24_10000 [Saprospiraceae bacterium]|nr:hypothetical protein [Saprospiraceae bacterium]